MSSTMDSVSGTVRPDAQAGQGHAAVRRAHHEHADQLRRLSRRRLAVALALIFGFMAFEVVSGWLAGSLALLAHAGHMLADSGGLGLALIATLIAQREASAERTWGYYRVEVLAVLVNVGTLVVVGALVLFEAYNRFSGGDPRAHGGDAPAHPEGLPILVVAAVGLIVNAAGAWVLHGSVRHSINVEGAFRHLMSHVLIAVGMIISALLIMAFGWEFIDPLLSVFIGVLILFSAWTLVQRAFHVLMEGVPEHIDVYKLCHDIEELEGVTLVHDVHVWTITSNSEACTAHVLLDPDYRGDTDQLTIRLQEIAHKVHGISHATFQLENSLEGCLEDHHVGHLLQQARSRGRGWSLRSLLPSR